MGIVVARPAVLLAIAFAAGILLAQMGIGASPWLFVIVAFPSVAAVMLHRRFPVVLILFIVIIAGWIRYSTYTAIADNDISTETGTKIVGFTGRIVSDPDMRGNRTNLIVRADRVIRWSGEKSVPGRVLVTVYSQDRTGLEYGQRVVVKSDIRKPGTARNPGEFSWADYLARQRIYVTASVRNEGDIEILSDGLGNPFVHGSLRVKRWLESGIGTMYPGTEGMLIKGILLGNYTLLPDDLVTAFKRSGTMHLLAASGLNCLVLILVFSPLLSQLRISRNTRSIVLIALLILYALIIGGKPSIIRATVMASFALLAYPLKRSVDRVNLLFAAALVILAMRPTDLFEIGFQLSFAAVAAIIGIMPLIQSLITRAGWSIEPAAKQKDPLIRARHWTLRTLTMGAAITVAATLGTAPLMAHYFNYVSTVSVATNTAIVALIQPIFALGLSAPVVQGTPVIAELTAAAGSLVTKAAIGVVTYLGNLPWASISVVSPGALIIGGYYLLLWGLVSYASNRYVTR